MEAGSLQMRAETVRTSLVFLAVVRPCLKGLD